MNRYRKGYLAERKSRAWLEARGYFVVEARGSHGACDLVAIGDSDIKVVQVKAGRKPSKADVFEIVQAMHKIPTCPRMVREIHHWPDYAREPTVEII